MDSTKIINNQPADGFHNSIVYRKCDRISGEGSGEIILSSDYGGVSSGNRVEMKKSSSPCKIPVQQKQKTNMSTGTKHSVKSSQLPRGKSTLIDQTTRISFNKQTSQQTSADSSRLPSKCTGKKSSLVNGDTNVKKQGDKNTTNLKNINVGKSVSSSKIHRNTALSKTKHQTTSDISSKNCNELISIDKHISTVLSEESPEDSESAIDEVKVVNELNDKFRLRSDSESSHASHSSFCSQLSTSSVKSSICLPSSTKGGLGKTSKILTSSCSRLAVSKAETKLQKKPSMLSRTTSSTTVSRTSNSALSHPSKSSPAHSRLTSRVNTENLQRAVSTGSLRNNSNKSSIPPTGRPNTTVTKSSGLSLRQKKIADSASDLSVNCTTRLGSKIQNKESLKTVSSENLSNKIQNSFGRSCENLTKKKKNVLQASCENLSVKSRNNCVTTPDCTLQQKGISHNKKLTSTQNINNGGLVHQKEKYSGGMSLLKASRISGSSSSSIPTAATAADKLDNKKLSNLRSSTSAVTERRTGVGLGSNQEGKPTTNIDRSQIKKSVPATGKKTTSLKSNEAIEPLSKKKLVAKTSRGFSDHKVTSNLPTASSKASSGIKKSKLLEAQSNNVISQTAGKNFQGRATYDSNRLQLDKTKNTLSVNEVENLELHYKELDDAPENEDKVDKDSSSTKPNISENFAYDDYMIITEALSDESISGPSVHVGDLDNVSNPNHLSDVDASESYQTSSSASALDISLHEDYVYNGSLVTSSSDNCTDKHTGFQRTQSAVHACREVTNSYQANTSEDECSEKEEKEETERKEDIEENRVKLKLSDHGVIKSDAYSDKTFDYEASYDCNLSSCGYQQPQKHYGQPYPHQQYPHHPPQHHYHPPHQSTGTENSFKNLSTDEGRGAQSSPQLHSINDSKCVYSFEFEEGQNQKQAEEDGEEKAVGESENLEEKASVVVFKSADIYRVAGHGMPVVEFTPPQIAHHNILRNENSGSGGCNPVSATDRTSKDVTATKTTTVLRGDADTEGELAGAERSDEEAVDCPVNRLLQRERDRPTSFTQVNVGEEALFKQQISFGEVAVTTTTTTILAATIKADVTNSSLQEMADQPGIQSSKLQLGDLHTSQSRTQSYNRDVMCEKGDLSRSTATLFMEEQQQQLNSNATRQMTGPFLPSEMGFLAGQMLSPCSNDSSSFKDISDGAVTPLSDVQEIFDQETSQLNDMGNVDELSSTCKLVSDITEGEVEGVLIEIEDSTLQVSGSPDGEDEIIVEEQDYVVTDERNYNEESTHFTNDDIIGERPIVDAGEDLAEVTLDSNETQNLWFSIEAETDSQYENLSTSITLENIAESSIGEDVEELLDQTPSIESSNTSSRIHGNLRESILRQLQTQISEDDAPDILTEEISPSLEHLQLRTKSEETDFGESDQQLISGCNEKMINKDFYLHSHQLEPCFHTDSLAENIQQRSADVKLDNFKSQTKNSLSGNTVLDDKNLLETNVNFNEDVQRAYTNSLKYGYKNEFDSLDVNICNNDISQEMEIEDGGFVILKNEGVKKTNDNSNQDFTLRQLQGTLNLRKQKILELCGQTESVSSKDIKSPSPTKISIDRKERSPSFKRLDAFCTSPGSVNENISPTKANSSSALNIPKADTLQNLSPKTDEIVSPIKESWIKHEGKWKRGYILDDGSSVPSEKYQDYILKSIPVTPSSDGEHSFEKYSSAQIVKSDSFEENSLTLKQEQSSNFEEISKCRMELFNQNPVLEEEVFGNNEAEFTHENFKMHKTVLGDIISSKESYDSVDGQPSEINMLSLDTNSKIKDYGETEITEAEMTHKSQAELTLQTESVQPVITEQKTYSPEIVDDIPFVDMDETVCDSNIVSIASVKLKNSASQDIPEVTPTQDTLSSVNTEFKSKEMVSILDLQENTMEQVPHPSVIESTSYNEHETAVDLDTITDDPSTHSSVDELKCEPLIDSGFEHPLHEFDNVSMAVSDIVTTNDTDIERLIDSGIAQPSDMDWVPITDEYNILPANAEECIPYLNCEPVNGNKRMQHDSDDALPIHRKEVVNEIKIDSPRKLIDSQSLPMDIPQGKIPGLSTDTERNKIKNKHTEKQEMNFANSSDTYHTSEETESSLGNQRDMSMLEQDIYASSPREVGSLCDEIFSIIGSPTLLNESWKKLSQNKSESDLSKSENELYFDGKRTYRNLPTSRSVYANIIRSSIYENSESESSESLDSITKTSYDDLKQTKDKNNIKLKGQGYSSNEDSPEGLMSSMDFYLDASEFARACWSDRSTLSEFYPVGSHQKLRASDSSTYGKGIYAVKGEDSQDIKLLAEISELDETCGENNHILSQTEHSENIQHNDNSLSRSETYWSPGSSPSMRKPYRRSLSLPFANHDGEDGRSILHCSKVDLEYPVTTAGFGSPPELPSKIGRSLRKHNTVRRFSTQRSLSSDCTKEKHFSTSAESHGYSRVLDDLSPSHHTVSFTPATEETAGSDYSKTLLKRTTDRPASLDEVQLRAQFLDLRLKGYNASEVTTSKSNGKVSPSLSDHFNKPCLYDSETGIIIQHGDEINYLPPKSPGILRRMFRRGRSFSEKVKPLRLDEVIIAPKESLARKMSMKSIFRRSRSGSNSSQKSKEFDASIKDLLGSNAGRLEDGSDDRMSKESYEKGSDPSGLPLTPMSDEGSHRSNFSSLSMISSASSTPPTSPASFSCTLVGSDIPKDEVFEDDNTLSLAYDKNYNSKLLSFRKSCKQHQPRNSCVGKGVSESEATGAYSGSSSNSNAYFAASDLHSGSGSSFQHPTPMSAQEMDKLAAVARGEMVSSNSSDSGIQHDSSLQSSNESLKVYQWKIGKEKERRDGYDFKVVDVTLGNEQMISENSHEVIHRKHSVSSRERPKSDINVHWPQHVKQVASYFDPRHLREHRESTISRPRPKSDLGGSTLSSEAMKEFLQGKLPQSQSQKTISEMNRTSYLVTKARRVLDDKMSTPHPIKSRIADRSALTKQKKILGRSHSMPENLNKIHKRRRIHPSGSDPLSDLLSQHSTNDDSSDESEVSMDYSLPDKCHSTRTSQLGLAPLDEIFETENLTYAEALWDHVTMDPDELAFRAGEVIKVTDMIDKDWWWGILEDKDGWFPANFVRLRANQDHHLEEAAKLEGADSSKDSSSNVGKTHQFNSNQARTNVINEIISAEREYVHQLDDVLQGYVVQAKKRPDMFPDDKISTIFGNLEDIYTFSKKFFKSLEVSLKDDLHQSEVGHCFIEHRKGFEIYSDYCNNHPHACDQLKELCKNKRYRHFFEGCRLLQDMKQIPLEGFLLTPVQKICKYPLQLAELLKYTSTSHPDYHDVCEALDAMKKIACLINERKRRMESIEKIAEWQATVEDWEGPDLLETSSELIYSGELSKVNSSGWTQERYFFLFDHQLIYCRKDLLKKNSFSFRGRIYLDHSKIYPVVDGRDPQFNVYVKNGWKLHDNKRNKSFLVFSKNAVEKDRWLKAFDEERKKVKSDQENGFTIPPSLRKSCARNSFRTKTQPERPKEKLMKKNMPMSFRHQQELWKNLPAHATLPRGMTNPTTLLERLPHTAANKKRNWFSFAGKKKR
ncbi:uncharacterized protein LOC106874706 isoform X4 [Octopus bimaculoides]|nr:uncharacterized protein LOC106874706 isoform X4 [Octopus bimaculoides]|eukprot:XP_014778007.1 PREDICTED: uncharacterized protein LOC106874706 isoform X2 [Octopus bimaculoides]